MKIGTRSVLFGAHQFLVHPLCLAIAWRRLYGFPWHPYLWLCFFVHDLGYLGKPNMDGTEGEHHPELGARIVYWLTHSNDWADFCLLHSRFYANRRGRTTSRLCVADKLAFCITPKWLYLATTWATGELAEYMANGRRAKSPPCRVGEAWLMQSGIPRLWHAGLRSYMLRWVALHRHDNSPQDVLETDRGASGRSAAPTVR